MHVKMKLPLRTRPEMLLSSLIKSKHEETNIDLSLVECLTKSYNKCDSLEHSKTDFVHLADKMTFKDLKRRMPNLSRYRFNITRHHLLLYGRGF